MVAAAAALLTNLHQQRASTARGRLMEFLRDTTSSGWDGETRPDLVALLTEAAIERHVRARAAAGEGNRGLSDRRTDLRNIRRALIADPNDIRRKPAKSHGTPAGSDMLLAGLLAGANGVEVHALVTALREQGHVTAQHMRTLLSTRLLRQLPVNAVVSQVGTPSAEGCRLMRAMATANAAASGSVMRSMPRTSTTAVTKSRRKSNREVMREAADKAKAVTVEKTLHDLAATTWPQLRSMPTATRTAMMKYRPQGVPDTEWILLRPAFLRLMSLLQQESPRVARNTASLLVRYLRWRLSNRTPAGAQPLAMAEVGVREDVNTWLAVMRSRGTPPATLATMRSEVRYVIDALHPDLAPVRLPYTPAPAPYSDREVATFLAIARYQPTERSQQETTALIALCAGAGLTPGEVTSVTPADLQPLEMGDGFRTYLVRAGRGRQERVVPLRLAFVAPLEDALRIHKERRQGTRPLVPKLAAPGTHGIVARVELSDEVGLDLQAYRLRNTWLVAQMQASVPLADLLRAAGLVSARPLTDLLPHCAPAEPARIQHLLAAATVVKAGEHA